jgi:hypothetical protein
MNIIKANPPERKRYATLLEALKKGNEALEVDITKRKIFDVYINRLKKTGMKFTTHKKNDKLLIFRTN